MKSSTRVVLAVMAALVLLSIGTVALLSASVPHCDMEVGPAGCMNTACANPLVSLGCPQDEAPDCPGTNQTLQSGPFTCVPNPGGDFECDIALDGFGNPLPWECMSFSQCYYRGAANLSGGCPPPRALPWAAT